MRVAFLYRAAGAVSRRLGRPELLALLDSGARQAHRESVGINAVLASNLQRDATYVDVGTNRGQVLREAVRIAPQARHIAFEPIPALAAELARELPQVDCRPMAIGARAEVTQFCHFRKLDGWSGLRRSREIDDERGDPEYITVKVSTLDAELAGLTPDVIKIDVEGAELDVLTGARSLLSEARPLVIFEHVASASALYDATPAALWDLLSEHGYDIFAVTGDGPFTRSAFSEETGIVNWLARPSMQKTR
jgi:FkbM family methyltransferase